MRPSQPRFTILCLSLIFLVAFAVHATSAPVDLSPNSLNFGAQVIGSTSGVSTVNLTNHLSTALTLFSITTLGDFAQTNNCGDFVAAGHSCTIKVTFTPTAIGARSGQLVVTDNDSTSPQSVALSGSGTATGLSSIAVLPSNPTVPVGSQQQLSAIGYFKNGRQVDLTTSVAWSSSDASVAVIYNVPGLVNTFKVGTTNISAALGSVSGSTLLTVTHVLRSLAIFPANPSVAIGKSVQFTALGTYSDSVVQNLTAFVVWNSSPANVASVSNSAGTQGLATGLNSGVAHILAISGSITTSANLVVNPAVTLSSIAVSPQFAAIAPGKTIQFTATGNFSDGSSQDITSVVSWQSSNLNFAGISNSPGTQGLATGGLPGTVTITAVASYVGSNPPTGVATLVVQTPQIDSIAISPTNPSILIADRLQFTATAHLTDGSSKDVSKQVIWSSADSSVAMVSNALAATGLVTGITQGSTAISAALPSSAISASTNLTVAYQPPSSISLNPGSVSIPLDDAQQFAAVVTFADGNSLDWTPYVTWSSSDPSVAASAGQGRVTSVALGSATVTASLGSVLGSATLTVSPLVPNQARFAYVANDGDSTLSAYRIDGSTGLLTTNGTINLGDSNHPVGLASDPLHKFLYAGNLNNFSMSGFAIDPAAGTLSSLLGSPFSTQFPWAIAVHPSSKFLYVASGPGSVLVYSLDGSGIPAFISQTNPASGGTIALAIDPLGKFVYTANVNANTVSAYGVDPSTGALAPVLGSPFAAGSNPFSVSVDPSGRFLYVPNVNGQSVSAYIVDSSSGALIPITGSPFSVGQTPKFVVLHPSGAFAYVLNQSSNTISAFAVDSTTGALSPVPGSPFTIADGVGPVAASIDPLGKTLYVVDQSSNSISIFAIDATSGALSSMSSIQTGSNPVSIVLTQ
jgi:6-phosphogluconolactonase (cycloisomerase 2 family)